MIDIYAWETLDESERNAILARANRCGADITDKVQTILTDVREQGDQALRAYTARFDGYDGPVRFVQAEQIETALNRLGAPERKALENAIANVTAFHRAQMPQTLELQTQPGVRCALRWQPLERVGLYIPAGSAPLVSTLIMCAVPATVAGCDVRVLCVPPRKDGTVDPSILAAAALCKITQILPIGGAQAIAALAFGTAAAPKVDKIFGPGNAYVTRAKQLVAQTVGGPAIDLPAGPSEVMVVAGKRANPAWIAADLLAQAEHGPDSQALLVTTDATVARQTQQAILQQLAPLQRAAIVRQAMNLCRLIAVDGMETALSIVNRYAPEHLILPDDESAALLDRVRHAGSVFLGPWTPETAGDYASGTNHVLPTYGAARSYGSLSLKDFMKTMSVQTLTRDGLQTLAPTLTALAAMEGLEAHAKAVTLRLMETSTSEEPS